MSLPRTISISLLFCLGLIPLAGPAFEVLAQDGEIKFPAFVNTAKSNAALGKATLPFMISLARRPELLQPPYMRLVLGTPDRARAYAYPSDTYSWTPDDGSRTHFVLSRRCDGRPPTGGEARQLVTTFKQSGLTFQKVRAKLGKPIRRYFDNRAQPVELYQITPCSTLAVCEPTNTFDVSQITLNYNGPYLPPASKADMGLAASFRLKLIDQQLSKGNHQRGLALLQDHLSDYPEDIQAHLLMACVLRRKCDVNGSIAEYRKALALAQACGDAGLQRQAIKALAPLGLVPADAPVVRALSLKDAAQGGSTLH